MDVPASNLKVEIAKILEGEGYIQGFKMVTSPTAPGFERKVIRISLKYGPRGERVISGHRSASAARAAGSTASAKRCPWCSGASAPAS